ncbi:MAG TPA: hypothetical protein VKZ98_05420 [Aquaticitalea sp.]|nr:hypothetical protein [Aquaticitalea sp.]
MQNNNHPNPHDDAKLVDVNDTVVKCPFSGGALQHTAGGGTSNRDWWPDSLS